MIFGLAIIVTGIAYAARTDVFMPVGGLLVGGGWFAFGKYGGLPLVDTVVDWSPPSASGVIDDMHRQGLFVMRHRRWIAWATIPGALAAAALLIPLLEQGGHAELIGFVLGVPLAFVNFRYYLSRCPRCGLGFFTRSATRAALLRRATRADTVVSRSMHTRSDRLLPDTRG
jgi:hypothetical protein